MIRDHIPEKGREKDREILLLALTQDAVVEEKAQEIDNPDP